MNPNTLLLPTVWPRAEPAHVAHCVLLALLAHIWLVLMLGNAAGGTARPGEGVWGAVNVTLRGPETPGAVAVPEPPVPAVATGPVGQAEKPRWGGAVRSQAAPELPPEPGAAQLGNWAPLPARVAAVAPLTPLPRAPVLQPTLPAGSLPEPGRPLEARAAQPPPAPMPMPVPVPVPAAMAMPLPVPERKLTSALGRPAAPTAAAEALALPQAATAPTLGRLPELTTPTAAPLMAPRKAPPALAAPVTALPSSQPVAAPVVVAGPAAVMKNLLAPAPPVAALPQVAAAPLPQIAVAPLPQAAAAPVVLPAASLIHAAPVGLPAGGAPAGTADAGTRLGHDVAGAAALPASAPPRLNLQLARPRGGELSRGLGGGVLAVLPRPPEVDEKLGQQIAKSAKADCRSAYAAAGLLAVVPLVAEALRQDSSCKW